MSNLEFDDAPRMSKQPVPKHPPVAIPALPPAAPKTGLRAWYGDLVRKIVTQLGFKGEASIAPAYIVGFLVLAVPGALTLWLLFRFLRKRK